MEVSKEFLNNLYKNDGFVNVTVNNLHSGPHYAAVFELNDKLYRVYYIDGYGNDTPRWLSTPNSSKVECSEVKMETITRVFTHYVDIDTPDVTPPDGLDYRA